MGFLVWNLIKLIFFIIGIFFIKINKIYVYCNIFGVEKEEGEVGFCSLEFGVYEFIFSLEIVK